MMNFKKIINCKKKNIMAAVGGLFLFVSLCGCSFAGAGETIIIGGAEVQEEKSSVDGTTLEPSTEAEGQPKETYLCVYVCGAVVSPGVVTLPEGSRIEDALLAAGGFTPEAAIEAVNLADWAVDGAMLYFPTQEEMENYVPEAQTGQGMGSGLVNINTADVVMLATLPGIGESRARDIIAYREKNGKFTSCEDIMKVSGIKTSVYEKICDKITVK